MNWNFFFHSPKLSTREKGKQHIARKREALDQIHKTLLLPSDDGVILKSEYAAFSNNTPQLWPDEKVSKVFNEMKKLYPK